MDELDFMNQIIDRALSLFGRKSLNRTMQQNVRIYKDAYEQKERLNFTAIFATALANKAVNDSTMVIRDSGGKVSRKSEWLENGLSKAWRDSKHFVTQALGKGGKLLIPYVSNGCAYVDVIDQSRMVITDIRGDEITGATILADIGSTDGRIYYRFADYVLLGNTHIIRNRATTDSGAEVSLETVDEWADIQPEITISGVDHILFGYLKCPQDSREDKQLMGVPITHGAEEVIRDAYTCLADIRREYSLKKSFVGADNRLFGKDEKLPENGLFKRFRTSGLKDGDFWQIYDPAIRDSAYLARFQQLCGLMESAVGVSPGILTEPRTANATATEIKSANAATFAMVDAIRTNIETAFNQVAYALDALGEYYGATPAGAFGDWQIIWDWDMSMMESSEETFNQLSELESRGLILPERLVSWVTGMDMDEAKKEVDTAKSLEPETVDSLLAEPPEGE